MIRVLGIDPGGTTGLAVLSFTEQPLIDIPRMTTADFSQTTEQHEVTDKLRWLFTRTKNPDAERFFVAVEKFVMSRRAGRSGSARAGEQARLIIGGVAQLCQERGVPFVQRPAGVVKPWATDRRLDAAGLLAPTKGLPHARDAARHALYAAVRDLQLPDPLSTQSREDT